MRKETENTWEREGLTVTQAVCRSKNIRRINQIGCVQTQSENISISVYSATTTTVRSYIQALIRQGLLVRHAWGTSMTYVIHFTIQNNGFYFKYSPNIPQKPKTLQLVIWHKYLKLVSHADEAEFSCLLFCIFAVICG